MNKVLCINTFSRVRFTFNVVEDFSQSNFTSFVRHYAAAKRFYKKTNVICSNNMYEIALDNRKLKTPKGNTFTVQSEPLALAIAAEWDAQKTYVNPTKMHLTGLCNTVMDNPNKLTKTDVVHKLIKYLDTDTVLYTSDEEDELYDLQVQEWIPIINWFCKRFDVDIEPSRNLGGPKISSQAKEILTKHLMSYNFSAVLGYNFAIEALKSVILCLTCAERHISVEKAVLLSRLEEEYQGRRWGRIEWSHEINQQELQARVSAGILFVYFNSNLNNVKYKSDVSLN